MNIEQEYINIKGKSHLKKFGQFFTDERIVNFMIEWTCKNANNVLDPAVGNNVFLKVCKKKFPLIKNCGYEIDYEILKFFKNTDNYNILNEDYLLSNWNNKYDAIVCNPPYKKFQLIEHRSEILKDIIKNTNISLSGYTNLYIYFLLKSIFQLSENGRMAYIIPTEFLNSKYGEKIKELLITKQLLYAIINFENNKEIFNNVITTSCIVLIDKVKKNGVKFYNIKSLAELENFNIEDTSILPLKINYSDLSATYKWQNFLNNKQNIKFNNLKPLSNFCKVSRGIVTGANDYFCFTKDKINKFQIPKDCLSKCICKSEDVNGIFFKEFDFNQLCKNNKKTYLLKADQTNVYKITDYINFGKQLKIDTKYIPLHRKNWYSIEKKTPAPIWVSTAYRKTIKFVRNLTNTSNLTTFHSIFINNAHVNETNLIFCYFLTPTAQRILGENRKEMGNGLNKFQPNDLNNAKMLDISIINKRDKYKVEKIYQELQNKNNPDLITTLDRIFLKYLIA